jgi:Acetyltransferase (GNAT) domain
MMTVTLVPVSDWPAIAGQFRDWTFEQSQVYGQAAAARIGGQMQYLEVHQDGRLVGAAAVRIKSVPGFGRGIAWIASGPLLQPIAGPDPDAALMQDILSALRAYIAGKQGHILRLRLPGIACHDAEVLRDIAAHAGFKPTNRALDYHSIAIDLRQDQTVLMSNLTGKWRTDLRFALKSELLLDRGQGAAFEARFLALFRAVQTAKGFQPDITPEFHFSLFGPDLTHDILIATKDGQDLAGIVIGTTGLNAIYLFGATADAGRGVRAGYFLTWEGIRLSQARGLHWYDLGGVDFDANPDVARFKDRMNGVNLDVMPYEFRPKGLISRLIVGLETARTKLRRWRRRGL